MTDDGNCVDLLKEPSPVVAGSLYLTSQAGRVVRRASEKNIGRGDGG